MLLCWCVGVLLCCCCVGVDVTCADAESVAVRHVDLMPTVLESVLAEAAVIPRQCDGSSLRPFIEGAPPTWWRSHVCWEFDLRWGRMGFAEGEEGAEPTNLDGLCLAVFRDATHKYVHFGTSQPLRAPLSGSAGDASPRLPPILFDLEAEGGAELRNLAAEPEHAALTLEYAQKMLSWRMQVRAIAAAFAPLNALTRLLSGWARTRTARSRT